MLMFSGPLAGLGWGPYNPAVVVAAQQQADDADAYNICVAEHPTDPAFFCSDYPGAPAMAAATAEPSEPSAVENFFAHPLAWVQSDTAAPATPRYAASTPAPQQGIPVKTLVVLGFAMLAAVLLYKSV